MFLHQSCRSLVLVLVLGVCVGAAAEEPKRDCYGDPLPEGAVARLGSLCLRPEWPVLSGAFTLDGKFLATGGGLVGGKGVITFWDPATGKEARRLRINLPFRVHGMHFSSDGKSLIVVGNSGGFRVLDAASGAEQRKIHPGHDLPLLAVDVARDNKTAVTTDFRGNIVVWDLQSGDRLREFQIPRNLLHWFGRTPFDPVTVLTPDGKQLVLPYADGSLHLMNKASGKEVFAFEMPAHRPGGRPRLSTVAVSPDGRYLAYGGTNIPITLCDLKTGKRLHQLTLPQASSMTSLLFAPNSRFLAVKYGSGLHLFDTATGKEIRKLSKSSSIGHPLALSPDGKTLALLETQHALSLWDAGSGRPIHSSTRHISFVQSIAFFADGKHLVSSDASGNRIVWDIASSQVFAHDERVNIYDKPRSLAVNTDGKTVQFLSHTYGIHRWDPLAGGKAKQEKLPQTNLSDFILSPDGRTLAATLFATPITQVLLRDLQGDNAPRTITMPKDVRIGNLLFSPDSRRLLIGAPDRTLRFWDRDTGKLMHELPPDQPRSGPIYPIFSPDGRSLAYYDYGAGFGALAMGVRIREIASGGFRLQIPLRGGNPMVFSPDGRFLACTSPPWNVVVLDMATGKELARRPGPQLSIFSLAFSPDSRLLASGYGDGTILLWKAPDSEGLPAALKEEEVRAFWQALADEDAAHANRTLAGLAAAPAQAVPLIKERFPTDWKKPNDKQIARWIAELDNDDFKVREQATRELSDAASDAAAALRQALVKAPSSEAKRRLEGILNRLNKGGSPKHLRALRAIEVLERIGTPQAKELLRELSGKPLSDELKEEVQASLRRMGDKP